jgi:hypothetical protein
MIEYAYQLNLPAINTMLRPELRDDPWKDIDGLVTVAEPEEFIDPEWLQFRGLDWIKCHVFKKTPGWFGPIHSDGNGNVQAWAINWIDGAAGGMEFWHPDAIESSVLEYDVGGRTDGRVKGYRHIVNRPADRVYHTPIRSAWLINVLVPHNGFNPITSDATRWAFSMRTELNTKPDTFEDAVEFFSDLIIKN